MLIISYLPAVWLAFILAGIFIEAYFKNYIAVMISPAAMGALVAGIAGAGKWVQAVVFAGLWLTLTLVRLVIFFIHKRLIARINIEGQTTTKG